MLLSDLVSEASAASTGTVPRMVWRGGAPWIEGRRLVGVDSRTGPPVSRQDDRFLYVQVAEELRRRIVTGASLPGDTLGGVQELGEEFRVGRDPVRRALGVLLSEGLIDLGRGQTARVRVPRERQTIAIGPDDEVIVRMPTLEERWDDDLAEGVPVVVVNGRRLPADRITLTARSDGAESAVVEPAAAEPAG